MGRIQLLQKFDKINATASAQVVNSSTNIVKGHVNKIMLAFPQGALNDSSVSDTFISVKLISDRVKTMITRLPLNYFVDLSDENFGSIMGVARDFPGLLKKYKAAGGTDANLISSLNDTLVNEIMSIMIDLGSFTLIDGDELEVSFERHSKANNDVPELHVYQISDEEVEDYHLISYDVDLDLNELHRNVKSLYLFDSESWKTNRNLDIYVDSESNQYQINDLGAKAYAMLNGRFENANPGLLKIYDNSIPEDVSVKVIGADAGTVSIMGIRIDTDFEKFKAQRRAMLLKDSKVMENLERSNPEVADVIQASGVADSSTTLMIKANTYKS